MSTAQAVELILAILKAVAEHAPEVLASLKKRPEWKAFTNKVGAASAEKSKTSKARDTARANAGLPRNG